MFTSQALFLATGTYLLMLFLLAYYAERRERAGRSIVANPWVYSLSLAVYCTSWTFYGSVGKAATGGLSFLTIYLGPTLMILLWIPVLSKVINIARTQRIITIADFIGARYGDSIALSVLVTVVATVGITPYIGLQIKAIIHSYSLLTNEGPGSAAAGWILTVIIGLFATIFGVRRGGMRSDTHGGLVFAVSVESVVKLAAFLAVGVYASYVLFGGNMNVLTQIHNLGYERLLTLGTPDSPGYPQWMTLLLLSMMAIMFLPRQFHMAVVENRNPAHLRTALWLFPLYMLLINIFVIPVAFAGLLLGGNPAEADYFVLTIPLQQGHTLLTLFVFIGGVSAASGMIIVESLAISNMVMNSIVNPAMYRFNKMRGYTLVISNIKRLVIWGLILAGFIFAVHVGASYSLVDMGLKSFVAVSIFAPAFFFGLYWKRGNRIGALAGISAGFAVWFYTLMLPDLLRSDLTEMNHLLESLQSSRMFNPYALFGLTGLDRFSHALFWGMFCNITLYVICSLMTEQSDEEQRQALSFVESFSPQGLSSHESLEEIESLLVQFLGRREAAAVVDGFLDTRGGSRKTASPQDLFQLKQEARRVLSGIFGSATAAVVFRDRFVYTDNERMKMLDSIKEMGTTLLLSRRELARANRDLAMLKAFSENIIESLPVGVVTLDSQRKVTAWNPAMEEIAGLTRDKALGLEASEALWFLKGTLCGDNAPKAGAISFVTDGGMALEGLVSPLSGEHGGFVIVLENATTKKRIEEELFIATKHAGIGRLAAGVSHEIGNPLASISSLVQELRAEDVPTEMVSSLDTMLHHINRIARIVRNLGDFARLYPRQKTPTRMDEALRATLDLVKYDRNFKKIEITTEFELIPLMRVDNDQFQQLFLNLLLNSRDAMPEGGRLHIEMRQREGMVEIIFTDSGPGIDPEIRDKIFDPFFSTKWPRQGTGLGLSICYSIVRDHGGTIEVSEPRHVLAPWKGRGARFLIRLPL